MRFQDFNAWVLRTSGPSYRDLGFRSLRRMAGRGWEVVFFLFARLLECKSERVEYFVCDLSCLVGFVCAFLCVFCCCKA